MLLQATLSVFSSNGLSVNGSSHGKNQLVNLNDGDEIVICDRLFRWESAREVTAQLDVRTRNLLPSYILLLS